MENHIEMSWGARRRYRGEETGNTGMSILSAMRCLYQFSFPQAVGNLSDAPSASPHDRSRPGHPILLGVVLSRRHAGSSLTLSQDLPDSDRNTSLVPDHQRSVLDNMVARLRNDHGLLPDFLWQSLHILFGLMELHLVERQLVMTEQVHQ